MRLSAADGEARRGPAESAPVIAAVPTQPDRRADLGPVAAVARSRSHGMPVSRGGQVTATQVMGQPASVSNGDVLEAEILDDPPPSRATVSAAAAEMVSTLTEVAFREARTDEWIMGQPEPVREPSTALELVRPGPSLLDSDSWDTGQLPAVQQDTYQGRRRAATVGGRLWLVISLVVAALLAAIAIPFVLTSNQPSPLARPYAGRPGSDRRRLGQHLGHLVASPAHADQRRGASGRGRVAADHPITHAIANTVARPASAPSDHPGRAGGCGDGVGRHGRSSGQLRRRHRRR